VAGKLRWILAAGNTRAVTGGRQWWTQIDLRGMKMGEYSYYVLFLCDVLDS
jgi:hypothetical protein